MGFLFVNNAKLSNRIESGILVVQKDVNNKSTKKSFKLWSLLILFLFLIEFGFVDFSISIGL